MLPRRINGFFEQFDALTVTQQKGLLPVIVKQIVVSVERPTRVEIEFRIEEAAA